MSKKTKKGVDFVPPMVYMNDTIKNLEVVGKFPEYYYTFSINPAQIYFYKSFTHPHKGHIPMTQTEVKDLLSRVAIHMHPKDKRILGILEELADKKFAMERAEKENIKATPVFVKKHNNMQETQRKAAQRSKLLDKYTSISPVLIYDNQDNAIAVCAKLKGQLFYVALNTQKPAFWKVSLNQAEAMSMEEVAEFIGFTGESQKAESEINKLAQLYQKFITMPIEKPSERYTSILYSQIRTHLAHGLQSFTPIERTLCHERTKQ